jgi:hypothetical protein
LLAVAVVLGPLAIMIGLGIADIVLWIALLAAMSGNGMFG